MHGDFVSDVSVFLVMTTFPTREKADEMASLLVEKGLAACVSVQSECRSVYRWRGAVESAIEVPLLIKTTDARYAEVEAAIRAIHPYETPEIIAIPLADGLPDYLAWVLAETQEDHWPSL